MNKIYIYFLKNYTVIHIFFLQNLITSIASINKFLVMIDKYLRIKFIFFLINFILMKYTLNPPLPIILYKPAVRDMDVFD